MTIDNDMVGRTVRLLGLGDLGSLGVDFQAGTAARPLGGGVYLPNQF